MYNVSCRKRVHLRRSVDDSAELSETKGDGTRSFRGRTRGLLRRFGWQESGEHGKILDCKAESSPVEKEFQLVHVLQDENLKNKVCHMPEYIRILSTDNMRISHLNITPPNAPAMLLTPRPENSFVTKYRPLVSSISAFHLTSSVRPVSRRNLAAKTCNELAATLPAAAL